MRDKDPKSRFCECKGDPEVIRGKCSECWSPRRNAEQQAAARRRKVDPSEQFPSTDLLSAVERYTKDKGKPISTHGPLRTQLSILFGTDGETVARAIESCGGL